MHQVSKPRSANHSITEDPGLSGTCRSKVGCEPIDEPCTNRMVPFGFPATAGFCQRKSLTLPLCVQCSLPCMERILEFFAVAACAYCVISCGFRARIRRPEGSAPRLSKEEH